MKKKHKPLSAKNNYTYIYGIHPALAALRNNNRKINEVYCSKEIYNNNRDLISRHKYSIMEKADLTKLIEDAHHQSIIVKTSTVFIDDIKKIDLSNENCKVAILDQVTDPHNIGAIIRSAAAFNISTIILPAHNAPDETATIAKTASGGLEIVSITKVANIKNTIDYLKDIGFWIVGLDGDAQETLSAKTLQGKVCFILGAEGEGMRQLTARQCDFLVKLPMSGKMESLNVSNAAAIVFYESFRHQNKI